MTRPNNEKAQAFWLGFSFGIAGAVALTYFLGTKKGRKSLISVIDFSEHLEENIAKIAKNKKKPLEKSETVFISPIEKIGEILNEIKRISNSP